jgi:peptide/nickel transport system substrate-binding protein
MSTLSAGRRRAFATGAGLVTAALVLTACAGGSSDDDETGGGSESGSSLLIGTTDKITTIDPAGSYDNGSFAVMNQVYPFLLNTPYGSPDVETDIAESAEFTAPTE